jgi:hypothetical protein
MTRKKLEKIICKYCQKKSALKIEVVYRFDDSISHIYLCKKCNKKTYIIIPAAPLPTNKEISRSDKQDIGYKLAIWSRDYHKRRSEPKKYEPMLYFLDLY